ncbi:hypothetical protein PHLGIDRAFT_135752 [Phlebiopsis gigantea 11061_1 CR5-6]|uniref:Uncharacterized protein n=1 Tax=Phlebiopsis gigantea (strain 11061_1 CR5-6) TaxID=745531 RepID=A0A0C3SFW5_PHLG1|nr:hypothetical protein PHLGIDRAFT_135752 [Phlebiopsis gigantea 11061_1 CR5-6]
MDAVAAAPGHLVERLPPDIQEAIVSLCEDDRDQRTLMQVRALHEGAVALYFKNCDWRKLLQLLLIICTNLDGVSGTGGICMERSARAQISAACIRSLTLDEDSLQPCSRCFIYGCLSYHRIHPDFLSSVIKANLRLTSHRGLHLIAIQPTQLSILNLATSPEVEIQVLLTHLERFTQLEELRLMTHRGSDIIERLTVAMFRRLSPTLRVFEVADSRPMAYGAHELQEFLSTYPRLTHLSLNPQPASSVPLDELPRLTYLNAMLGHPGLVLKVFRGLFTLEDDNFSTAKNHLAPPNLHTLDLGFSRSSRSETDNREASSYIRTYFPNVLVRGHSEGILNLSKPL